MGFTNHQAVELLRNTGPIVRIKFERYLRGPKFEQLQQAIRANELKFPTSSSPTTMSSLPKIPLSLVVGVLEPVDQRILTFPFQQMTYLGIEPEGESRTSFDFDSTVLLEAPLNEDEEIVIGGRRSLAFSISSNESIYDKWKDRVGDDVDIVVFPLVFYHVCRIQG